jgi:hypothetical protein
VADRPIFLVKTYFRDNKVVQDSKTEDGKGKNKIKDEKRQKNLTINTVVKRQRRTIAAIMGRIRGRNALSILVQRTIILIRSVHSTAAAAVEDQAAEMVAVATVDDSKAEAAEDNMILFVVEAALLVAPAITTAITTIAITTNITEAIAVVIAVKSRALEVSKDNKQMQYVKECTRSWETYCDLYYMEKR